MKKIDEKEINDFVFDDILNKEKFDEYLKLILEKKHNNNLINFAYEIMSIGIEQGRTLAIKQISNVINESIQEIKDDATKH